MKVFKFLLPAAVFAVLALCFIFRGYGEVSQRGYRIAIALYSACNQRDDEKLTQIEDLITQSETAHDLHANEIRWLRDIIRTGQRGHWDAANRKVRRLMVDQIKPASESDQQRPSHSHSD